jgi:hypothetical protein
MATFTMITTQHTLETGHSYCEIEDTMDILRINKKGRFINVLKKPSSNVMLQGHSKIVQRSTNSGAQASEDSSELAAQQRQS